MVLERIIFTFFDTQSVTQMHLKFPCFVLALMSAGEEGQTMYECIAACIFVLRIFCPKRLCSHIVINTHKTHTHTHVCAIVMYFFCVPPVVLSSSNHKGLLPWRRSEAQDHRTPTNPPTHPHPTPSPPPPTPKPQVCPAADRNRKTISQMCSATLHGT